MKVSKQKEVALLRAIVQASPEGIPVWVERRYSEHFRHIPMDGRTYFVQDSRRPWIFHVTNPNGTCARMDSSASGPGSLPIPSSQKLRKANPARANRTASNATNHEEPHALRLIPLAQVMRLTGFKKSFIYEQLQFGFPAQVRLGSSRRSASRWVESEVVAWIEQLSSKRTTTATSK